MKYTLCVLILSMCLSPAAMADIDDKQAVLAIIGEAENQGYGGMRAVAHAIRNRGMLKGVYGVNSPRVVNKLYPEDIYWQAQDAWAVSGMEDEDPTNGATHWENIKAFGKPRWADKMVETYRYGDHVFYKER